jgi:hypothetical protein
MRIKLFEMFNKDDYYVSITFEEWGTAFENRLSISDNLNNRIKNLFDPSFYCQKSDSELSSSSILWRGSYISVDNVTNLNDYVQKLRYRLEMKISLNDDEWYYVYLYTDHRLRGRSSEYYKCDQLHGLEKLLKDKKII